MSVEAIGVGEGGGKGDSGAGPVAFDPVDTYEIVVNGTTHQVDNAWLGESRLGRRHPGRSGRGGRRAVRVLHPRLRRRHRRLLANTPAAGELERAARQMECLASRLGLEDGDVVDRATARRMPLAQLLDEGPIETEQEYHHPPIRELDTDGQGDAHLAMMYVAHRAMADVDPGLGLVRVVEVATAQDIGAAVNPTHVLGQIEGGIAQGMGLAVMEEIVLSEGRVRNPSFTDYLIPTTLDSPAVVATLVEEPEPDAPFGAKGVGEPPTISSGPAVLAAVRDATGLPLERAPIRPDDIALHPANLSA